MPVINQVYEHQRQVYENIVVPVSDGTRVFQVLANLETCYNSGGKELVRSYEKSIILATIDQAWQEHLRELDDLRQSVRNAQYEQKDPLLIYKFEAFELFTAMIDKVNKDVVSTLMKAHIPLKDPRVFARLRLPSVWILVNLRPIRINAQLQRSFRGRQGKRWQNPGAATCQG